MRQLIFILLATIGVSQAQTIQYIGAPTTTVISRGNFRTDSIFYLPKRTKLPTDTAALRYQISDSSLYAWSGSQWRKVGADADTLVYSTRAWRQKGDDSLAARINLKVNISDTASMLTPYLRKADTTSMLTAYLRKGDTASMLSPYYRSATASAALALKLNISDTSSMLGNYVRHAGYGLTKSGQSFLVDTLNIATRAWRQKGLDSLAALEVSGSGTTNYVAKFTAGTTIGNSQIFDNGTNVGVATAAPEAKLTLADGAGYRLAMRQWSGTGMEINAWNDSYQPTIPLRLTANYLTLNTGNPNTERLRITSGGDIGISQPSLLWTATNRRLLELNGTSQSLIGLNVNSLKAGYIWQNGNDMTIATENAGYIQFGTNGSSDRMRIFSNGRVGINTTTDAGYQLDVNGSMRSVNGAQFATSSGGVGIGVINDGTSDKLRLQGSLRILKNVNNFISQQGGVVDFVDTTIFATTPTMRLAAVGSLANAAGFSFLTGTSTSGGITEKMVISGAGDVGINQASPSYKLDINGTLRSVNGANFATTSGNVGIGTSTPTATASKAINIFGASAELHFTNSASGTTGTDGLTLLYSASDAYFFNYESGFISFGTANTERGRINSAGEWIIDASGTDAGDYKLQVVGNARVGTGKLDIASNTTFGLGIARSGTSEIAGQIYNSNGILYLGAESSAGGQIFSGSSAYAAVIGSGANYPLQFAANNITRATLTTNGNFMIGFPTDTYFYRLQVNGSIFSNNQIIAQNAAAQLNIDSSTNISPLYISNQSLTGSSAQGLFYGSTTWNTTGNPSLIDLAITNTASGSDANYIKISDGSNIFRVTKAAEVVTAAPSGGSIRKWKLGEAATVSPTSPNRTIRVEIDGTVYYLHAKTTND